MDSNGHVEILFGGPELDRHCIALGYFTSVRARYVETNNALLVNFFRIY